MRVNVTTRNDDGSILFTGALNKAEVETILQYGINNLMAMGFVMNMEDLDEDDDTTVRIKAPTGKFQ